MIFAVLLMLVASSQDVSASTLFLGNYHSAYDNPVIAGSVIDIRYDDGATMDIAMNNEDTWESDFRFPIDPDNISWGWSGAGCRSPDLWDCLDGSFSDYIVSDTANPNYLQTFIEDTSLWTDNKSIARSVNIYVWLRRNGSMGSMPVFVGITDGSTNCEPTKWLEIYEEDLPDVGTWYGFESELILSCGHGSNTYLLDHYDYLNNTELVFEYTCDSAYPWFCDQPINIAYSYVRYLRYSWDTFLYPEFLTTRIYPQVDTPVRVNWQCSNVSSLYMTMQPWERFRLHVDIDFGFLTYNADNGGACDGAVHSFDLLGFPAMGHPYYIEIVFTHLHYSKNGTIFIDFINLITIDTPKNYTAGDPMDWSWIFLTAIVLVGFIMVCLAVWERGR